MAVGLLSAFLATSVSASAQTKGSVVVNYAPGGSIPTGQLSTVDLFASYTDPDDGYETYKGPTWVWTATGVAGLSIDTSSSAQNPKLKATISPPGKYTITVKATATWTDSAEGTVSASDEIQFDLLVVGVQKLQSMAGASTYSDVEGVLYVPVGESLSFQAISTPAESTFPTDQPVWSGSAGATGTGATTWVTFSDLSTTATDYKTVTATCGDSYVTANVIVYDFDGVLTPVDDFEGRSYDRYGVCETINLSYTITPSSVTASDIGGLEWEIDSGGGDLAGGVGGTGTYHCSDEPGQFSLRLFVSGGPFLAQKEKMKAADKDAPTLVRFEKASDSKKYHLNGTASCGFKADMYFEPTKVSFAKIVFKEGACKSAGRSGAYDTDEYAKNDHTETKTWIEPTAPGKDGKGSQAGTDTCFSGLVEAGKFQDNSKWHWDIPWVYLKAGDHLEADGKTLKPASKGKHMFDARQQTVSDAKGICTISKPTLNDAKKRVEETAAKDDPTIPLPK